MITIQDEKELREIFGTDGARVLDAFEAVPDPGTRLRIAQAMIPLIEARVKLRISDLQATLES